MKCVFGHRMRCNHIIFGISFDLFWYFDEFLFLFANISVIFQWRARVSIESEISPLLIPQRSTISCSLIFRKCSLFLKLSKNCWSINLRHWSKWIVSAWFLFVCLYILTRLNLTFVRKIQFQSNYTRTTL